MPCSCTAIAFRSKHVNPKTGLRKLVFSRNEALHPIVEQSVPLGICMHCRLKHSRNWGLRVALESTLYENNCFLTLTYRDEDLPKNGSLDYDVTVKFMKDLRDRFGSGIRSFGCAEYGEKKGRPHYHICLLNFDFPDKKIAERSTANYGINKRENYIYDSEKLQDLWPYGDSKIGSLTLESASYVARYCTKKITGPKAFHYYDLPANEQTGEIITLNPEKSVAVSRRKGLGYPWYEKFGQYVRDHDRVNLAGRSYPPPPYFDKLTEKADPDRFEEIKAKRRLNGQKAKEKIKNDASFGGVNEFQRMLTIEQCQALSFKLLKRTIENG